jgi:pyruvate dehydrogenase E1 component alpha subunit
LPITYIVEDNGKSVCSDTLAVWNIEELSYSKKDIPKVIYYKYETKYPHAGSGKRIQF